MIQTSQTTVDHLDAEAQKGGSLYATVEEIRAAEEAAEDAARCDGQMWANLPESAKQHYRDIATGNGPGAYGGPEEERIATDAERATLSAAGFTEEERIATDAERATLSAAGFTETKLQTLWIAPPSYGGRILSVDESLEEIERTRGH